MEQKHEMDIKEIRVSIWILGFYWTFYLNLDGAARAQ